MRKKLDSRPLKKKGQRRNRGFKILTLVILTRSFGNSISENRSSALLSKPQESTSSSSTPLAKKTIKKDKRSCWEWCCGSRKKSETNKDQSNAS